MSKDVISIETSISASEFREELLAGIREYNESKKDGEPSILEEGFEVKPAHGFTGAEIAVFFGSAIVGGITYDVCKYVVLSHVLPRINARFGADAAKLKEDE